MIIVHDMSFLLLVILQTGRCFWGPGRPHGATAFLSMMWIGRWRAAARQSLVEGNRRPRGLAQSPLPAPHLPGHCVDLPDTGLCKKNIPRWYYNPFSERCARFTYGGCYGNKNNFEEEQQCLESCRGISSEQGSGRMGDREGEGLARALCSVPEPGLVTPSPQSTEMGVGEDGGGETGALGSH